MQAVSASNVQMTSGLGCHCLPNNPSSRGWAAATAVAAVAAAAAAAAAAATGIQRNLCRILVDIKKPSFLTSCVALMCCLER